MKNLTSNLPSFRYWFVLCVAIVAATAWLLSIERTAATAQQVPTRIAVVDVNKVLTQSNPGRAAYDKLKKMQDDRRQKALQMDAELKQMQAAFDTGRAAMTQDKVTETANQIAAKRTAMQRYAQDSEREISEARDRELGALEAKFKPVVDTIGKEMGLAAVFNKFESGLIYASDAIDITNALIARLNAATPPTE